MLLLPLFGKQSLFPNYGGQSKQGDKMKRQSQGIYTFSLPPTGTQKLGQYF